jgi:CheY-like chemotaxis protein
VQAAGFAAFVPKPITPPQRLLDAVRAVLEARTA